MKRHKYIRREEFRRASLPQLVLLKHSGGDAQTSFPAPHLYWALIGEYLNGIRTVKRGRGVGRWGGSPPGNPEDGYVEKGNDSSRVLVLISDHLASFATARVGRVAAGGGASTPTPASQLHWGGVSPTISMPCCWSCARSSAFSFFNSSIWRRTKKRKKKDLINNISIPVTVLI